jgi:tRNA pseudouridine55 synthase
MDGMPLYDYARKGIPLPRPIEPRSVTVHELKIVDWLGQNHSFTHPGKTLSDEETQALAKALHSVDKEAKVEDDAGVESEDDEKPTAFVLSMKVTGGTYVRSIVHDLAHAVGSAGHVVTLTRSRQGDFCLEPTEASDKECIPWETLQDAIDGKLGEKDEEGWNEWERLVLDRMDVLDVPGPSKTSSGGLGV